MGEKLKSEWKCTHTHPHNRKSDRGAERGAQILHRAESSMDSFSIELQERRNYYRSGHWFDWRRHHCCFQCAHAINQNGRLIQNTQAARSHKFASRRTFRIEQWRAKSVVRKNNCIAIGSVDSE